MLLEFTKMEIGILEGRLSLDHKEIIGVSENLGDYNTAAWTTIITNRGDYEVRDKYDKIIKELKQIKMKESLNV